MDSIYDLMNRNEAKLAFENSNLRENLASSKKTNLFIIIAFSLALVALGSYMAYQRWNSDKLD